MDHADDLKNNDPLGNISFECACVLARLSDLIELDPSLSDAEEFSYHQKHPELFLISPDVENTEILFAKYEKKPHNMKKSALEDYHEVLGKRFKSVEIVMQGNLQRLYFSSPAVELTKEMKKGSIFCFVFCFHFPLFLTIFSFRLFVHGEP